VQGKFFQMATAMFEFQDYLEWEHIYRYADGVGCDIRQFDEDLRSARVLHRVEDDAQDAELMDLGSTPTFFVNGVRHKGPWDAASLIRALEDSRA
jgi:predicted DsbA family dithiol-disulfide isomerase